MDSSIDVLVSAVAERNHGVFSAGHLRELGVAPHERKYRLVHGRWALVHERVYRIVGNPLTWRGRVLAACWAGGRHALASHRSAAELWQLPGRTTQDLEITCPHWRRGQRSGLLIHESRVLDPADAAIVDGIPVTTVERTLFDLTVAVGPVTLDLAIENALRRKLTTIERLDEVLSRLARRGRAGTVQFRTTVRARDPRAELTESEAERLVLRLLERQGLPRPVAQFEILDPAGRFVARVDFAYPDCKIAIEYDSFEHHTGRGALVRDSARRNAVVALGWLPISVTAQDLRGAGDQLGTNLRRARALRTGVKVGG